MGYDSQPAENISLNYNSYQPGFPTPQHLPTGALVSNGRNAAYKLGTIQTGGEISAVAAVYNRHMYLDEMREFARFLQKQKEDDSS